MSRMTVADLIDALQGMPQDAEVRFTYDYGDHCHTTVAAPVHDVEEGEVARSDYHSMDKVVEEDYRDSERNEIRKVVILS